MTNFKARIEQSSLGSRSAKVARSTVSNQVSARVVARANQIQKSDAAKNSKKG